MPPRLVCSFPVRLEQSGIALFVPGLQGLFLVSLGRLDWFGKNQDTHSLQEGRVALRVLWNRKAFSCGSDKITGVAEPPAFRFPTEPREPGSGSPCCGQPAEDQALKSDSTPGMLSPLRDRGQVLTARLPETPILSQPSKRKMSAKRRQSDCKGLTQKERARSGHPIHPSCLSPASETE